MLSMKRWVSVLAACMLAGGATGSLQAQAPAPAVPRQQVISANPFGLLLDVFNAEYERKVSTSATAGFGGSTVSGGSSDRYVNADVFYRFYPSGTPLEGWAFGVKLGVTSVTDYGSYLGFGFDVNRSWILGVERNFYVGVGFGLKRLYGQNETGLDLQYIPTIRIVNVGFAF
jgi:hypothetical protein